MQNLWTGYESAWQGVESAWTGAGQARPCSGEAKFKLEAPLLQCVITGSPVDGPLVEITAGDSEGEIFPRGKFRSDTSITMDGGAVESELTVQGGELEDWGMEISSDDVVWTFLAVPVWGTVDDSESARRIEWDRDYDTRWDIIIDGRVVASTDNNYYRFSSPPEIREFLLVGIYNEGELPSPEDTMFLSWTDTVPDGDYDVLSYDEETDEWEVSHETGYNQWERPPLRSGDYTVKVEATDYKGATAESNTVTASIDAPPVAPSNLTLDYDDSTGVATLRWDDSPTDGVEYTVRRSGDTDRVLLDGTPASVTSENEEDMSIDDTDKDHVFLVRSRYSDDLREEGNISEMVKLTLRPNTLGVPEDLEANILPDGYIRFEGVYNPYLESGPSSPGVAEEIRAYWDEGSGDGVSTDTPVETIPLGSPSSPVSWTWDTNQLEDGVTYEYLFVAASDTHPDGEEGEGITLDVTADRSTPEAPVLEVEIR